MASITLISDCKTELNEIEILINSAPLDPKVQYLTMYSLIKSCGTVEHVFKSVIADFFSKISVSQIQNYLELTVRDSSTNPKYNQICTMLKKFDDQWATAFKAAVNVHPDSHRLMSSIDSLVTNRNQFAHGKNPTVSFKSIKDYFDDAIIVLKILDACVK